VADELLFVEGALVDAHNARPTSTAPDEELESARALLSERSEREHVLLGPHTYHRVEHVGQRQSKEPRVLALAIWIVREGPLTHVELVHGAALAHLGPRFFPQVVGRDERLAYGNEHAQTTCLRARLAERREDLLARTQPSLRDEKPRAKVRHRQQVADQRFLDARRRKVESCLDASLLACDFKETRIRGSGERVSCFVELDPTAAA